MPINLPINETVSGSAGPTIVTIATLHPIPAGAQTVSFPWTCDRAYASSSTGQWQVQWRNAANTASTGTVVITNCPNGHTTGTFTNSTVQTQVAAGATQFRLVYNTGTGFTGAWSCQLQGTWAW